MKNIYKILMTILILVIMPVVMGVVVVKLFLSGNGTILTILFIGLVVLGILALIELLLGISVRRNKIILKGELVLICIKLVI